MYIFVLARQIAKYHTKFVGKCKCRDLSMGKLTHGQIFEPSFYIRKKKAKTNCRYITTKKGPDLFKNRV